MKKYLPVTFKKTLHVKTRKRDSKRHVETLILQNGFSNLIGESWGIKFSPKPVKADYQVVREGKGDEEVIFCNIDVMGSHDGTSFISLYNNNPADIEQAELFYDKVLTHFAELDLIVPPKNPEPWKQSPPDKQERDRIIWEARQSSNTWEKTAELAGHCGVSTAKEAYTRMQRIVEAGNSADSG
jgi:hypothetical protein